jgi:hypothetical protein
MSHQDPDEIFTEDEEESQWEEDSIREDIEKELLYDEITNAWIDLKMYVQGECLPWLDKLQSFTNFLGLFGY